MARGRRKKIGYISIGGKALFTSCKILDEIYCNNFKPKIRSTKYDIIIKLITQFACKL